MDFQRLSNMINKMDSQNFELLSLTDIFNSGNRSLRIPDYQRGYSWETSQRKDLIEDIEYIIKGDYAYRHYTGTIVATRNEEKSEKDGIETFDIVDGQQRTTSLVLLISVLAEKLKSSKAKNIYPSDFLVNTFIGDGMKTGNTVRKFISGKEQDGVFKKLIFENERFDDVIESKSDQNLVNAYKEFKCWVDETKVPPQKITKCIIENLGFLFYAPENDTEIGIMFEVINNRGKALSQLEKIKNYLIYFSQKNELKDLGNTVKDCWPDILSRLNSINYTSNDDEDRFLRNCWIVFKDTNKAKSYHVYDNLKEHWPPDQTENWESLKEFVQFMHRASLTYTKFLGLKEVTKDELKWLRRIKLHPQNASVTPLILAIYERVSSKEIRIELLELLEKLNFRFYGTGIANRADSGQGKLFTLAHNLYNKYDQTVEESDEIYNEKWLKKQLIKFVSEEANDSSFVQHLTLDKDESGDYYHWAGLKFFLTSYEESLKEAGRESLDLEKFMNKRNPEAPNDFFHREHIWAKAETKHTSEDEEPIMNKRRLGNFILLKETQNIKVSNAPVEEKVEIYWKDRENDPNTLMIRKLKVLFNEAKKDELKYKKWEKRTFNYYRNIYTRFLDKHEELMVNFALKRWRVDGIKDSHKAVVIDSMREKNEVYHFKD